MVQCICMRMKNIPVALNLLENDRIVSHVFEFVKCYMIFMEDFRCNAQLVAGRDMALVPSTFTYAFVVSLEMICILAFILSTLN